VLGAAGALSLAGGASAAIVGPAEDTTGKDTLPRHVVTLSEEEVFDVNLATFYVFDKEEAGTHPPGIQLEGVGWRKPRLLLQTRAKRCLPKIVACAW
jgi:hypothetical protein